MQILAVKFSLLCFLCRTVLCLEGTAPAWIFDPTDGPMLGEHDTNIIDDFISIIYSGIVHLVGNCTHEVDAPRVTYWYVNATALALQPLNSFSQLDPTLPIKYIVHGWHANKDYVSYRHIWEAYSKFDKVNVVMVDYSAYSSKPYQDAVCNIPAVSRGFSRHLCELKGNLSVPLETVHVIGHSLGGQLAGLTGKKTQRLGCGTIGRITALDAAGPLFQGSDPDSRLDQSDALFVDAIHTNQGQFGYVGNIGHIDFYPNCGTIQPGCLDVNNLPTLNPLKIPVSLLICNHLRVCNYFAESIERNAFRASSCLKCSLLLCIPNILNPAYTYMGESNTRPARYHKYTLTTNFEYPYGRGPVGFSKNNIDVNEN